MAVRGIILKALLLIRLTLILLTIFVVRRECHVGRVWHGEGASL